MWNHRSMPRCLGNAEFAAEINVDLFLPAVLGGAPLPSLMALGELLECFADLPSELAIVLGERYRGPVVRTLRDVGEALGITREETRRREELAMYELRLVVLPAV